MATSTTGDPQIPTKEGQLVFENNKNRITLYDPEADVYRMIIGILPDGTVGIAISKEGEDVFEAFS